jgi:hypothetical protein
LVQCNTTKLCSPQVSGGAHDFLVFCLVVPTRQKIRPGRGLLAQRRSSQVSAFYAGQGVIIKSAKVEHGSSDGKSPTGTIRLATIPARVAEGSH